MVLSSEIIERRLRVVDQTSESIQTTSMWITHHKDSIAEIVKVWNELFKSGKYFPFGIHLISHRSSIHEETTFVAQFF